MACGRFQLQIALLTLLLELGLTDRYEQGSLL